MVDNDTAFKFLDRLRNGGSVNMFGAYPYLQQHFGISKQEALDLWSMWMATFGERTDQGAVDFKNKITIKESTIIIGADDL